MSSLYLFFQENYNFIKNYKQIYNLRYKRKAIFYPYLYNYHQQVQQHLYFVFIFLFSFIQKLLLFHSC